MDTPRMVEFVPTVISAIVQGVSEFLPISSDGHLAIVYAVLDAYGLRPADPLHLTVALHVGTLLAVVTVFHRELRAAFTTHRRVAWLAALATIPAGVVGLAVHAYARDWLDDALLAGVFLIVNGLVLLWGSAAPVGRDDYPQLSVGRALLIGLAQATAVLPGVSRSGTTIATGLRLGLSPTAAPAFSFLLSLPVVAGATLVEFRDDLLNLSRGQPLSGDPRHWLVGMVVSYLVGLLALKWLLVWLRQGKLVWFAVWCFVVGTGVTIWQLALRFG